MGLPVVGAGSGRQIDCPLKGRMALARCLRLQSETKSEGSPCTCYVFRQHPAAASVAAELAPQTRGAKARAKKRPAAPSRPRKTRKGTTCDACGKRAERGTRIVRRGKRYLCAKCRKGKDAAPAAPTPTPAPTRLARKAPAPARPAVADRQTSFKGLITEAGELRAQLAFERDKLAALSVNHERLSWAVRGFLKGFVRREELARLAGL